MLIIDVGDQHTDTRNPRSRRDNYWEAIQKKLLEIRDLANEWNKTEHTETVFKGDLIHVQQWHRVHYALTNWLIEYFRGYDRKVKLIIGNHDIASVTSSWVRQPIGAIIKAGVVDHLSHEIPMWAEEKGLKVAFTGTDFYYDIDKDRRGYAVARQEGADYHVHVVHGVLLPDNRSFITDYTPVGMVRGCFANLVLCGHIHEDLGCFTPADHGVANGAFFQVVNYGAISRGTIAQFDMDREVMIGVVKLQRLDDLTVQASITPRKIACMVPASEVFYLEELKKKKLRQQELTQLAETLGTAAESAFEMVDPEQLLEARLSLSNVNPRAAALVRHFVMAAKQELT